MKSPPWATVSHGGSHRAMVAAMVTTATAMQAAALGHGADAHLLESGPAAYDAAAAMVSGGDHDGPRRPRVTGATAGLGPVTGTRPAAAGPEPRPRNCAFIEPRSFCPTVACARGAPRAGPRCFSPTHCYSAGLAWPSAGVPCRLPAPPWPLPAPPAARAAGCLLLPARSAPALCRSARGFAFFGFGKFGRANLRALCGGPRAARLSAWRA